MKRSTSRGVVGAVLCLTTVLAGCAEEPRGELHESDVDSIMVSINGERYQQLAVGEVVTGAFVRSGRQAFLDIEHNAAQKPRIDRVTNGQADLVVGCTGELLFYMDPERAKELSEKYLEDKKKGLDPNDGTWRDTVYQEMVGALPSNLMATDPSNAQGCPNYDGPELPQNVVPVFREVALNRQDRVILNKITGGITTDDLKTLVEGDQSRDATRVRADELLTKLTF